MRDRLLYHVGVSGGKDSAAALLWMVNESGIPREQIRATCCDTDNEDYETYDHLKLLSERVHPIEMIIPPLRPERIDFLREQEWPDGMSFHSFFARNKVPFAHRTKEITTKSGEKMMVCTIDDVIAWTKTKDHKKKNQLQYAFDWWFDDEVSDDVGLCPSSIGVCE